MTVAEETGVVEKQEGVNLLEVVSDLLGAFFLALHRMVCMDPMEAVSLILPPMVYMDQQEIISLVLHQGVCSIGIAASEIRY